MIVIDIPMPQTCMECPCSHLIQSGTYNGWTMCAAAEWKDIKKTRKALNREDYLVEEWSNERQAVCPIRMEVRISE